MPHNKDDPRSACLAALADPTRRAILDLLARKRLHLEELAAHFPVSLPAVSTHLRSLLPPDLRVQYFVLLPFEGVELEGVMPSTVVTPQDLPYIARVARSNGRSEQCFTLLDHPAIDRTLQLLTDLQGELTLDEHIRNTREKSAGAAATRTTHPGILKLQ